MSFGSATDVNALRQDGFMSVPSGVGRVRQRLRSFATLRMFAEDRVLLFATLLMSSSALLPLAMTPILPLVDLGSNVGAAALLDDAAFRHGAIAKYYRSISRSPRTGPAIC